MAHIFKPRVAETSTTTGTGAFTLAGALTGHQTFASVMATNDTTEYVIVAVDANGDPTGDWEEGIGTYSSANTLTRTTVTNSSNSGSAVNFGSGAKVVLMTPLASRLRLENPRFYGSLTEQVFTITDGAAFEIDPANGTIQTITLGASRTPKGTNFAAGQSVTLMVLDGTAYTLTWTDTTFGTSGVVWVGGSAPTLDTTKYTIIELWKVGSQVYGSSPGAA